MLGCGKSLGLMIGTARASASPLSLPSADKLLAWFEPDQRLALSSTLLASGPGSPPVATISGNLSQPIGLTLICSDISAGASLGQAKFDAYYDGGVVPFLVGANTGASVFMSAIGVTVAFAAGTFVVGQRWDGLQASWGSIVGTTILTSSAGYRPLINWNGHNGLPTIHSPAAGGVNLTDASSGLATALVGGIDKAFTVMFVGATDDAAPSGIRAFMACASSSDADPLWLFGIRNGTNNYRAVKVGDAATAATNADGGALDLNYHRYRIVHTGTQIKYYVDGILTCSLLTQSLPAEALTVDTFSLFTAIRAGLTQNSMSGSIGSVMLYTSALSDADCAAIDDGYLSNRWDI